MSLNYSSEIRKLFSQISLKKQEIEQLRSKELLTAEDENAIIDNAIDIARLEVKISEQQEKKGIKQSKLEKLIKIGRPTWNNELGGLFYSSCIRGAITF